MRSVGSVSSSDVKCKYYSLPRAVVSNLVDRLDFCCDFFFFRGTNPVSSASRSFLIDTKYSVDLILPLFFSSCLANNLET